MDYEKLDNWLNAKTTFGKIIGKVEFENVNKKLNLFKKIEETIKDSDKACAQIVKLQKKKQGLPNEITRLLTDNNNDLTTQAEKLQKDLDDNLEDKYDNAIDDLISEIELYRSVYTSFHKSTMNGKGEDLSRFQNILNISSQFLQPGSFSRRFELAEETLQVVARELRKYTENKATVTIAEGTELINLYNSKVPGNKDGIRSLTTFLKAFIDYQIIFEKHKISESEFKKLKLHPSLTDYITFRKYVKGASIFIKKLTPFANSSSIINTNESIQLTGQGSQAVINTIAEKLMTCKRLLIQAKTFYIDFI